MAQVYDSQGERLTLGKELGRGGEGSVFAVQERADTVAKIYHEPVSAEKAEKLRQMVVLKTERILRLAAWVTDVLRDENGATIGFLMPRLAAGTEIHELYNPSSRRRRFPEADWRFLLRAAANTARAFAVVHSHNHAVGDVNHGNVVIARDATVRLIDCDSYHLNAPDKSFLCEVGVSTHTPPELQGKSLRETARTANHDNFGLAVLIFQLLFMGRHPFSGKFLGAEENTLENSIRARRFAYGDGASARQMKQPPGTLPLDSVSPAVAKLFERAFLEIDDRPTAREWTNALENLETDLHECRLNAAHFYWRGLAECPWCQLETETGVLFFPARYNTDFAVDANVDLVTIGKLIDLIKPPDVPANLPVKITAPQNLTPNTPISPHLAETLADYKRKLTIYLACVSLVTILMITAGGFSLFFSLVSVIFVACIWFINHLTEKAQNETRFALNAAKRNWEKFQSDWQLLANKESFINARQELKKAVAEFKNLPALRDAAFKQIETEWRARQLDFYLKGFPIRRAEIKNLSPAQIKELNSARIVSADDITDADFRRVPYFSPPLKNRLFAWRRELESKFSFALPPQIQRETDAKLDAEFGEKRSHLEREIRSGVPRLQNLSVQITENYRQHVDLAEGYAAQLANAEADAARVADLKTNAYGWTIGIACLSLLVSIPVRQVFYPSQIYNYSPQQVSKTSPTSGYGIGAPPPPAPLAAVAQPNNVYLADGTRITPEDWGKAFDFYQDGVNQVAAGDYEKASKSFQNAIALKPEVSDLRINLGEAFYLWGRYRLAIVQANDALKINPSSSTAYHLLGESYNKLLRRADAIVMFKKAVEIKPDAIYSLYELGKTLRDDKKPNEAIKYLNEALKKQPELNDARFELALCYDEAGFKDLAIKEYNKLKTKDANLASKLAEKLGIKSENANKDVRAYVVDEG